MMISKKMFFTATAQTLFLFAATSSALSMNSSNMSKNQLAECSSPRRSFLTKSLGTAFGIVAAAATTTTTTPAPAFALDMDAFINSELSKDNANVGKSNTNDDATTCRYGAPGPETGDACVRAGMPTTRKAGGVDAYGKIDRGDFVRCTTKYVIVNDKYEKIVTCTDSKRSYIKEA